MSLLLLATACGDDDDGAAPEGPFTADEVEAFFLDTVTAMRDGDAAYLIENLHPSTYGMYGREACEEYLRQLQIPGLAAEVVNVIDLAPWTMNLDGVAVRVRETYSLLVTFTRDGQQYQQESHLGLVDGELFFFADCGEPLEQPGGPSIQES